MSSELLQPVCKKLGLFWAHHFFSTLDSIFFQPYLIFLLKVAFIPPTSLILKIINGCIKTDHSGVMSHYQPKQCTMHQGTPVTTTQKNQLPVKGRCLSEAHGRIGLPSRSVRGAHRHCAEATTGGIPLVP